MIGRWRGWLAAVVAGVLLVSLALVSTLDADRGSPGSQPTEGSVAGRPVPAEPESVPAEPDAPRVGEVRAMLDKRAAAVLGGTEAAFMATIDPRAAPNFVAAQRALFHNLRDIPLEHWSYRLSPTSALSLPDDLAAAADEYWAPRTALRYALAGVDVEPTSRPMAYVYVRRGERWFLASDTALEPQGERTWRGLWDFGPCTVLSTERGLVLGHDGLDEHLLETIAAELDDAVRAVSAVWGPAWSQRVAVLVPTTVEQMRALIGPGFNVDGIAAAAIADKVDVRNDLAVGQRIVLNPMLAGRLSTPAMRIVLRHEITHIAARSSTVDGAPMWLLEGVADYVGYRDSGLTLAEGAPELARAVRRGELPDAFPDNAEFVGGNDRLDLAYQQAWSIALFVVDRVGEDGLVRLHRVIAGSRDHDQEVLDAAVSSVLGTDFAEFVRGWRDWLAAELG